MRSMASTVEVLKNARQTLPAAQGKAVAAMLAQILSAPARPSASPYLRSPPKPLALPDSLCMAARLVRKKLKFWHVAVPASAWAAAPSLASTGDPPLRLAGESAWLHPTPDPSCRDPIVTSSASCRLFDTV
jgi:hypothetical protein